MPSRRRSRERPSPPSRCRVSRRSPASSTTRPGSRRSGAPPAAASTSGRHRTRAPSTTSTSISPAVTSRIFRRASTTSARTTSRFGACVSVTTEARSSRPPAASRRWLGRRSSSRAPRRTGATPGSTETEPTATPSGTLERSTRTCLPWPPLRDSHPKSSQVSSDRDVEHLLGLDPAREGALALVPLGRTAEPPVPAPDAPVLNLETEPLSSREIDYPAIREIHSASSLVHGEEVARWRGAVLPRREPDPQSELVPLRPLAEADWPAEPLESVILRRGSTRRFDVSRSLTFEELSTALAVATATIPADFTEDPESSLLDLYVIAHAVEGLPPGAYYLRRAERALELLEEGEFRAIAGRLGLFQELPAAAGANVYCLADLERGPRPVRQSRLSGRSARGRNRRRPPLPRRLRTSFRRHGTHLPRRRGYGVLLPSRRGEERDVPDGARPHRSTEPRSAECPNCLAMLRVGAPAGGLSSTASVERRARGSRSCRRGGSVSRGTGFLPRAEPRIDSCTCLMSIGEVGNHVDDELARRVGLGAPQARPGRRCTLESWNEAPPRPDPALARPSQWTRAGIAAAPCCRGRRCFCSACGGQGIRGVLQERRACPPSG